MNVLLVDDSYTARQILWEILCSFDLKVTMAASAHEAMEAFEQAAVESPFDLILLDWKMPETNGFEIAGKIRSHPFFNAEMNIPRIIMISMYGSDDFSAEKKKLKEKTGIDAFLLKPVSSSELFNSVMEVMDKKEAMVPRLAAEPEAGAGTGIEKITGARILLVEDNNVNQDVAAAMLERVNLEVAIVENGRQAVDLLKKMQIRKAYFMMRFLWI